MSEALLIWLYMGLGNLLNVLVIIACAFLTGYFVILFGLGVMSGFGTSNNYLYEEETRQYNKLSTYLKTTLISGFVILSLNSLYPDKEDLKWIIGGALVWNGVEAASDIKGIEALPENTVKAMNNFLESTGEAGETQ